MADKKISQLTTLAQADVAVTADFLPIVDTGSTETKKVTPQSVVLGALGATTSNVGIGTSSPQAKLEVAADTNATVSARISQSNLGTSAIASLRLDTQGNSWSIRSGRDGGYLSFHDAGGERARFDNSGNLGIGTSSPGYRLDVVGDAKIRPSSGYNAVFEVSGSALRINYLNDALSANVSAAFRAADFVFQTAGATERARITSDGNIVAGGSSVLATNATNGFLYVPTCAGTPTGTPTAITGMVPIVVDTTNNRWYFYSGGAWRNAGP